MGRGHSPRCRSRAPRSASRTRPDKRERERDAVEQAAGLRTNENCAWVSMVQWPAFLDYEELVQEAVRGRRKVIAGQTCALAYCRHGAGIGIRQ